MKRWLFLSLIVFLGIGGISLISFPESKSSGAPPYGEPEAAVPADTEINSSAWWRNWSRPEGPAKVAIQVGHWQNDQFPEELAKLRNNTGASGGGKTEAEVNLAIAENMKPLLEDQGILVEILPATVPPNYWADVFIAIHADGSEDPSMSGYKFAGPWRDLTGTGDMLVQMLNQAYGQATGLDYDPNITRNMRGYYAFAWWRYDHSIHPMTTAVIAETGFLTSANDRKLIVDQPEFVAQTISDTLVDYLELQQLL